MTARGRSRQIGRLVWAAAFCAVVAPARAQAAAAVTFRRSPRAVRAADKVRITFDVSAPTDVEVAILRADGKVARHLAAGVLGGEGPGPVQGDID